MKEIIYQGNDKTRRMQVLNQKRDFEIQSMKENEILKEFSDKLMTVMDKITLKWVNIYLIV